MQTDYKISQMVADENDFVMKLIIKFYEGQTTTENEVFANKTEKLITRYRRISLLKEVLYTYGDFGRLKLGQETLDFLNIKLSEDKNYQPIKEQTIKVT